LSLLYKSQSKLDEAERMYQRALQGYEKSLGLENVARHRPALNTISNLGDLFATQLGVSGQG
jgi:Tetratricopeptide repeat